MELTLFEALLGPRLIIGHGGFRKAHLRCGPVRGVIIERDRIAPDIIRASQRVRMPVVGCVRRRKENHSVEFGQIARNALADVGIPQLEGTAPSGVPVTIEVEQEIKPAVKLQPRVVVEIGVDFQEAAPADLVDATTL